METIPYSSNLKRKWRSRRGYNKISSPTKRGLKVARFGATRSWRLTLGPKLRLVRSVASPLKLWYKVKNAYANMMVRVVGYSGVADKALTTKRIPRAREAPVTYSKTEFENRLIFEICKNMVASYELGYHRKL